MSDTDDRIVEEFLVDSHEGLERLDHALVGLERDPRSPELLADAFRTLHTIKGTCSFLGFTTLERVADAGESLLGRLRSGERVIDLEITSALLGIVDAVRVILSHIQTSRDEGPGDHTEVVARVEALLAPAGTVAPHAETRPDRRRRTRARRTIARAVGPAESADDAPDAPGLEVTHIEAHDASPLPTGAPALDVTRIEVHDAQDLPTDAPAIEVMRVEVPAFGAPPVDASAPNSVHAPATGSGATAPGPTEMDSVADVPDGPPAPSDPARQSVESGHLRVDVGLLDRLMNTVGELVLARNQLVQFVGQGHWSAMPRAVQRLNHVTSRLQDQVMRTRMQPVATLLGRLPRIVRDVAKECGKQVELVTEGATTELDRTLIEALKDPLLHLVRNAVDHGIESPERRVATGKRSEGRLRVAAYHEGGLVHLEISDDGHGISIDRIRETAIERGWVASQDVLNLTDREWLRLIFMPGFSTTRQVTKISGRGVGMDVVRDRIARIGGTIDVDSKPGVGTTFSLRVPLTLAIIPALMVELHDAHYAIPQVHLLELVRLRQTDTCAFETVHDTPVFRLRGRLLPLLFLAEQLGLAPARDRVWQRLLYIVVVQCDGRRFGIVVEGIHDTEEIVVKPLDDALHTIGVYAGATILGDGRPALILDVPGLARRSGLAVRDLDPEDAPVAPAPVRPQEELLLVRLADDAPVAVLASRVSRIEEFAGHAIEAPDRGPAVQWRGHVLPLVPLATALYDEPLRIDPKRRYHVLVQVREDGPVGFIVDRVEDVVRRSVDLDASRALGPVLGRAVLREQITDIVDLNRITTPYVEARHAA